MKDAPGILIALAAGFLSFASPCVLPLVPSYLSFLSGQAVRELEAGDGRNRILLRAIAFVLGFSAVFVVLGGALASSGFFFGGTGRIVNYVAGGLVVLLGLNTIFDFLKFLNFEKRFLPKARPRGLPGAFLFGAAFAAGWSPCVGPILASILLLAGRRGDAGQGILLLGAYSLGLAVPFLAFALFLGKLKPFLDFLKRRAKAVKIISGLFLILVGISILFGRLSAANSLIARAGFALKAFDLESPGTARTLFGAVWAALGALFLILWLAAERRGPSLLALLVSLVFAALSVLQFFDVYSTARILSEWLLYQGI